MRKTVIFVFGFLAVLWVSQAMASAIDYHVAVNYNNRKLAYKNSRGDVSGVWDIAVAKSTPKLPVEGIVTEVIINPCWSPTENTKKAAARKGIRLKDHYGPGQAGNAMGKVKFILNCGGKINSLIRLHATNQEDSIGQRVSRGCIRMRNQNGLELASLMTGIDLNTLKKIKGEKRIKLQTPVKFYYQI